MRTSTSMVESPKKQLSPDTHDQPCAMALLTPSCGLFDASFDQKCGTIAFCSHEPSFSSLHNEPSMRRSGRRARRISPSPSSESEDELASEVESDELMDEAVDSEDELSNEEQQEDVDMDQLDELSEPQDSDELESMSSKTPTPPSRSKRKKPTTIETPEPEEEDEEVDEEDLEEEDLDEEDLDEEEVEEEEEEEEEEAGSDQEVVRSQPMTKRQKARLNKNEEDFLELPMDSGRKKTLTEEEEALRKSEVARRRKNQSLQRAEKDKTDTINRLLKKQASKTKRSAKDDTEESKEAPAERLRRLQDPNRVRYIQKQNGDKFVSQLCIPKVYKLQDIFGQTETTKPKRISSCQVSGCKRLKKYVAKKSGKAVCSLEHYKVVEAS